jgi:hypothetical protein
MSAADSPHLHRCPKSQKCLKLPSDHAQQQEHAGVAAASWAAHLEQHNSQPVDQPEASQGNIQGSAEHVPACPDADALAVHIQVDASRANTAVSLATTSFDLFVWAASCSWAAAVVAVVDDDNSPWETPSASAPSVVASADTLAFASVFAYGAAAVVQVRPKQAIAREDHAHSSIKHAIVQIEDTVVVGPPSLRCTV